MVTTMHVNMSAANVTKVANVINEVDIEQLQTLWVGGLNEKVTEEILYELFQNAGPLLRVHLPVDKESKRPKNFAFIRFAHVESVPFAIQMFGEVKLFGQGLKMQNRATGAGMPGNQQNRYQPPAGQPYNGQQRGGPPPPPPMHPWQNEMTFQQQQQHVGPFQGFSPAFPAAAAGQNNFPRSGIHQRIGFPAPSDQDQQLQQNRRDHQMRQDQGQMRHGRDDQRHGHEQHRSHSRGFDRNNSSRDHYQQHHGHHNRDRSYDNRSKRR